MKFLLKLIEVVLGVAFVVSVKCLGINSGYSSRNIILAISLIFCAVHLFNYFTKNRKFEWPLYFVFVLCFAVSFNTVKNNWVQFQPNVAPVYDTNTETGFLQQEIYELSGVKVFYNTDANEVSDSDITYTENYHITDDKALECLTKIKEVLSFYSGGLPKKIFIVNSFDSDDVACDGLFVSGDDIIVLRATDYIDKTLHHEVGHSIEHKTFDIKSIYKYKNVNDSCRLVSDYACENDYELFAEVWRNAVFFNKTSNFSLALSDVFKKNIRFFDDPNYIEFYEFEDGLDKLINGEIDSFVIKKGPNFSIEKLLSTYPELSDVHYLDVVDEMLVY